AAFTAVYVANSASILAQNQRSLEALADTRVSVSSSDEDTSLSLPLPGQEGGTAAEVYEESVFSMAGTGSAPAFSVTVGNSGNLLAVDSFLDLPREAYEQAAAQAWENPDESVLELLGRQWLYAINSAESHAFVGTSNGIVVTTSGDNQIRFLDITESQTGLRTLLITLIVIGLVALAAIFASSLLLANRSVKPIAWALEQQRRFVADASHELKTPLAIITTNSDALLANQEQTIASQREWLDYLRIGTDRMTRLIDELLGFARIEEKSATRPVEQIDLSAEVHTTLSALRAALQARHL
ncbi:MAG: hypothetical protein LBI64_08150, partial [Coriobacteriales bacterium]|nr:hypothetical protein [Coriobacteriales bacterium]